MIITNREFFIPFLCFCFYKRRKAGEAEEKEYDQYNQYQKEKRQSTGTESN